MKKLICLLMCLVMIFSIVACTEDGEYSSDILDYLEDLSYQEGYEWVADFELLDLSKVGCKLG